MVGEGDNKRPLPTTAQIAMQQGEHLAENIKNIFNGEKLNHLVTMTKVLFVL